MQKLTLSLISVFFLSFANAQAYKDSIKNQFMQYNDLIRKKEFNQSFDYVNPAFFSIIKKEQLLSVMEQTFNNPEMEFRIDLPVIISIGDSLQIKTMSYSKLKYSGILGMRFVNENRDTASMINAFGAQFGKENVSYNAGTGFYTIKVFKNVVANSTDGKGWTFVVVEERQRPLLEKFIPKELL